MEKTVKPKKKIVIIKKTQEPSKLKKTKDPSKDTSKGIAREVKYIYPDDCNDILSRKNFRGKVRTKCSSYELKLSKLEPDSNKYKKLNKEFKEYKKTVFKQ